MKKASITDSKNKFSALIDGVKAGGLTGNHQGSRATKWLVGRFDIGGGAIHYAIYGRLGHDECPFVFQQSAMRVER